MAFRKALILVERLKMYGLQQLYGQERFGTARKGGIAIAQGQSLMTGLAKIDYVQHIGPGGLVAATAGIAVASSTNLLAKAVLAAGGTTTFLDPASLGAGILDYPRTIQLAASASTGDGTFGASGKAVIITGIGITGETIKEEVPLNSATPVTSRKAFYKITKIEPGYGFVAGTDDVGCGYGPRFALMRPVIQAADLLNFDSKATAATAWTPTTLASGVTLDVGEASSVLAADLLSTDTSIVLPSGAGAAWPNSTQITMAELIDADGTIEEIIVTSRSTDTLTVLRGKNGTTARRFNRGAVIAWRPGMTIAPTITGDDRYRFTYKTQYV